MHPDLTLLKIMDQVESVPDGAAQPVEGVNDDDITRAGLLEGLLKSGPISGGSGFLVDVDVFIRNTFFTERVDLAVEVLFRGGNPGVTNIHDHGVPEVYSVAGFVRQFVGIACGTVFSWDYAFSIGFIKGVSLPRKWDTLIGTWAAAGLGRKLPAIALAFKSRWEHRQLGRRFLPAQ